MVASIGQVRAALFVGDLAVDNWTTFSIPATADGEVDLTGAPDFVTLRKLAGRIRPASRRPPSSPS
jgi:hypothetical protein